MDPKKQALSPDLKQVYERVMNTQVKPQTPPGSTNNPASPTIPPAATPPIPGAHTDGTPPNPTTPTPSLPTTSPGATIPDASKPISDTGFVFSGNKMQTPQGKPMGAMQTVKGGKKMSAPIIMLAIVVGIIVWGIAWAKIFGLF